ncbi:MAG TPA: Pr6Pr family membrane protein [Chitinophagaceae bacterium]
MRSEKIIITIIALTAWVALSLQLYILIDNTPGNGLTPLGAVGRFLHFFTILSNLLVAVSLSVLLVAPATSAGRFFAKPSSSAAIALYIFIVGLVYNTMLRSLWQPHGLQKTADELLHIAVPLLYLSYWLIFSVKRPLQWTHAVKWLVFPAVYLVYVMIRGAIEGFYPYPFIDVDRFGYGRVALNSAGLLAVFIAAGLLFVYVGKTMSRRD